MQALAMYRLRRTWFQVLLIRVYIIIGLNRCSVHGLGMYMLHPELINHLMYVQTVHQEKQKLTSSFLMLPPVLVLCVAPCTHMMSTSPFSYS